MSFSALCFIIILSQGGDSMNIFGALSIASAVVTCIGAIAEAVSDND